MSKRTVTLESIRAIFVDPILYDKFIEDNGGQTLQLYVNKGQNKKFDRDQVIITLIKSGVSQSKIALAFDMTQQSISKISKKYN